MCCVTQFAQLITQKRSQSVLYSIGNAKIFDPLGVLGPIAYHMQKDLCNSYATIQTRLERICSVKHTYCINGVYHTIEFN